MILARTLALAAAALLFSSVVGARVVLVGVDGGAWPLIDAGIEKGTLPHFAALASDGVTAELATVEPVISPVVWTSIATGRTPEAHGVHDFFRNRTHIRVPTIFERLSASGLRVGLYDYLVTWPARPLPNGFMIPGWLRRNDAVVPEDVFARAGVEPFVYDIQDDRTPDDFLETARAELKQKASTFNRLVESFSLDVGVVSFYSVDLAGHRFWRAAFPEEFDEAGPASDERYRGALPEALRGIDAALGEVRATLGSEDSLIVVSDHGFQAGDPRRVWLTHFRQQLGSLGLDPQRDGFRIDGEFLALSLRVLPGPFEAREGVLERLVGVLEGARTQSGEPLFQVEAIDIAERPAGRERSFWTRLRQWAVRQVVVRFFELRLDRPAHAFIFARPADDTLFAQWPDGRVLLGKEEISVHELFSLSDFSGTHHPTAIFLAAGGPLRAVAERGRLSVLDVAPLIAYLAGAPVPDDLEGRVPEAWIEPAHLAAHPVRLVPASTWATLPPEPASAAADDSVLMERLRALGYVD